MAAERKAQTEVKQRIKEAEKTAKPAEPLEKAKPLESVEKPKEQKPEEKKSAPKKEEEKPLEEKILTISLRAAWRAPRTERTKEAVRNLKAQIKRHTGKEAKFAPEINKIFWKRGMQKPPHHIKVRLQVFKDYTKVLPA